MLPQVTLRYVRFKNDELDAVPLMVRSDGPTLLPGTSVEVELGGRWTMQDGHRLRLEGQWVTCVVIEDGGRDLCVEVAGGNT